MFSLRTAALVAFAIVALHTIRAALPAGSGDPVVDVTNGSLTKLNAADGTVQWSTPVPNDGALAVDSADLSVYTALGGHAVGTDGTVYKFNSDGSLAWVDSININSYCDFEFVTNATVDATSSSPGVIWSESGCFGALAKSDRATGSQLWSVLTYDLSRPSTDPFTGQIFAITNAGNSYDAETIYSVTAGGSLSYAASCEGFTEVNPADGMLYRGGGDPAARGCGTTLSQMNSSILGATNWSVDLSSYINSLDAIAVQPWQGGYVYAASVASSKIVVVNPATQSVVTTFSTAVPPRFIAVDPNQGNLYVASDQDPFVIAYGPTGALIWINPNLGGNVSNLATARGLAGTAPPTPTPTPTPACAAPTVRIVSDRNSIRKGESATINMTYGAGSATPCTNIIVYFTVKTKAKNGVDFTFTDANGQDATQVGVLLTGPLTLRNLYTSRKKTLPVNISLKKDPAYYDGNSKVTVQLLAR
ncbi:MAG TPA: PQQ-binding-like beta-propeller repeat protein [Chthoniobacterales bacterium]|nr:PQQ-binding-like beta-propeller repeat protein [Chthoniobacterales bacterium]